GGEVDEGVDVAGAADAVEVAGAGQVGGDGDRVRGIALGVQVADDAVDRGVRRLVEVPLGDDLDDVGDHVFGEHHRAEDGPFRFGVLGRHALQAEGGAVGGRLVV